MLMLLRLLPLFLFYLVAMFLYQGMRVAPQVTEVPLLDRPLPAFAAPPLIDGGVGVASSDFGGKPAVLSFFAVDCVPCANQMAALEDFADDHDLRLFGINMRDDPGRAVGWLERVGNPYLAVGEDKLGGIAGELGVTRAPELLLVDEKGRIRFRYTGAVTEDSVKYQLAPAAEQMLRQTQKSATPSG